MILKMIGSTSIALLMLLLVSSAAAVPPPEIMPKWLVLMGFIDRSPDNGASCLDEQPLAGRIKQLTGDKYEAFRASMRKTSALKMGDFVLYITGSDPDKKAGSAAAIVVDPRFDIVYATMIYEGQPVEFKESSGLPAIPREVKDFMGVTP